MKYNISKHRQNPKHSLSSIKCGRRLTQLIQKHCYIFQNCKFLLIRFSKIFLLFSYGTISFLHIHSVCSQSLGHISTLNISEPTKDIKTRNPTFGRKTSGCKHMGVTTFGREIRPNANAFFINFLLVFFELFATIL